MLEFLQVVLGVEPTEAGFSRVNLAPLPCGLEHARGSVITPNGPIEVSWTRREGSFTYRAHLPEGVVGRLQLPGLTDWREVVGLVEVVI